jgi:hypothetical protein
MASEVGICNAALINLGEATILSLTEDTKPARLCNQRYAALRDAVLRSANWNFAIERAELALLTTAPEFEFTAAFQLPTDLIRVIKTDNDDYTYRREGSKLLCNRSSVKIQYIKQVTDPNEFDALFIEALAARIAMDLAKPLTDDVGTYEAMARLYESKMVEAKSADAHENGSPETFDAVEWLYSRY